MKNIAIITGASAGLGWHFGIALNKEPDIDEIWLVARRENKLQELAAQLPPGKTRIFAIDLVVPDQLSQLFDALHNQDQAINVTWLINNAGFGKIGPFNSVDLNTNLHMIDLNIRALTEITQQVLHFSSAGTKIVQIASTAGFVPITNFAVYAASKAYVLNFSNALAQELKPQGITVTTVCPGPVDTEFLDIASTNGAKADTPEFVTAQPERVVEKAIRDVRKGKLNSIYGTTMQLFAGMSRFIPRSLALWATQHTYK